MQLEELLILLPCHSLDDFPVYHRGDDADSLLANWSALWHPQLIHAAQSLPNWNRADSPSSECERRLFVAPSISLRELPTGFDRRVEEEGGFLVSEELNRETIVSRALGLLGLSNQFDEEVVLDFHALGYGYLQIQLLTRHMRYSSNLDQKFFEGQVVQAANLEISGDREGSQAKLQACFDVLAEERDHYYPVDVYLLDLTLIAETTLGDALELQIADPIPSNLLMTGECADKFGSHSGSEGRRRQLVEAIEQERISVIGGEAREGRLPLFPMESLRVHLEQGLQLYQQTLDQRPVIYGRRRFGLTPALPQVLTRLGFNGALHATLDDGRFPEGMQVKTEWEGAADAIINSFAKIPLNASLPETFLNLAIKLGEAMDMEHVAIACFAHWPGAESTWYRDLRRLTTRSRAMGEFVTMQQFLQRAADPGHSDPFRADGYRSPYLTQAVALGERDPISRWHRLWQAHGQTQAENSLAFLRQSVEGKSGQLADREQRLDALAIHDADPESTHLSAEPQETDWAVMLENAAKLIPRQPKRRSGALLINPSSFARRMHVELPGFKNPPSASRPVYAAEAVNGRVEAVVDVPAMGFAWIDEQGDQSAKPSRGKKIHLAEEWLLRNEYFEAVIDPKTGGLRTLHEYNKRKGRASQQLGYRGKKVTSEEQPPQSSMVATSIELLEASTIRGCIRTEGELHDQAGELLARFAQTMSVRRGSRVLELEIELEPLIELGDDPWNSYICSRLAWRDEAADLSRSVNQLRYSASNQRMEATEYFEAEFEDKRVTLFTYGHPFHQKTKMNVLESLLVVKGETARHFRLGIGLDVAYPGSTSEALRTDPLVHREEAGVPQSADSSWLFHIDAKGVIATRWEMLEEGNGFRVHLLETIGRSAQLRLQGFREFRHARLISFEGREMGTLQVEAGAAVVPLCARDYLAVEVQW